MAVDGYLDVIEDNTDEWGEAYRAGVARGLEEMGLAAEGYAKALCPVDTGRLRNSITHAREDELHEVIGTNVEYGRYVELGTSRAKAQPFLAPAAGGHTGEYAQIMRSALGA